MQDVKRNWYGPSKRGLRLADKYFEYFIDRIVLEDCNRKEKRLTAYSEKKGKYKGNKTESYERKEAETC